MALTRIENNQISNAISGNTEVGINGNLKLQEYSVTGSRLANDLSYGSNFSATGNVTAGNVFTAGEVSATGNIITAGYFLGNIACATGYNSNTIYNGTSNVLIATANGNITMAVDGTPNVVIVTANGVQTNNISTSGNAIIGGDLVVNGNLTYVNVTDLNVEDPIIGLGRGPNNAPLTTDDGKDRGEQLWYYAGGEKSAFTGFDNSAGKILLATDVTITNEIVSVNNLGGIVTGNVDATGTISATGTVTAGNVATAGTISATGTATAGNLATAGTVSATGDITGGNINTAGAVSATGTVTAGNVATAGSVTATGSVTGGNVFTGGTVSATGDVQGGNLVTGGAVTATGTVTGGNIATAGSVTATGTVTGGNIATAGSVTATGDVTGGNLITAGSVTATGTVTGGNIATGGEVSAGGNITGGNVLFGTGVVSGTGNIYANNIFANITGNIDAAGSNTEIQFNDGGILGASSNLTFASNTNTFTVSNGNIVGGNLLTAGTVSATSTIQGGNILTAGEVSATGSLTGGNVFTGGAVSAVSDITGGNLVTGGQVTATGTITGGNVVTGGIVSATGDITGGNINTAGAVSATGTVTAGNVATAGSVTATGTVTGGNIATAGTVSATGNITGDYFFGNGSQLTGIDTNLIKNGDSNVRILTANGNISMDVAGTSNVVVVTTAGIETSAISASGTITGGNLSTAGSVTATGDITGGNINTAGSVSATGNVTANNVNTANVYGSGTLTLYAASGDIVLDPSGNIVMDGGKYINNVNNPVQAQDAATKQYVDDAVSAGIHIHTPVYLEANSAVGGTYAQGGTTATVNQTIAGNTVVFSSAVNLQPNDQLWFANSFEGIQANTAYFVVSAPNTSAAVLSLSYSGAPVTTITSNTGLTESVRINSGVGATLTNNGANATLVIDGVTTAGGERVLIYSEANAVHNGVYVVSEAGNATTAWQLTRSSDADLYIPNTSTGLDEGSYFFVQAGNSGAGESYVLTAPSGPFIIGYDNLTFTQFSASGVYSANTNAGLSLTGTTFSAKVDNNTTAFDLGGNIIVKAGANLTTPNIGAATGTSLSATGNIEGGNVLTGGVVSATGNVTGGNVTTAGAVDSATVSASGTITGGNVSTAGFVTATGDVTGGNLITSGTVTATGTVTGGNIATAGSVTATGDVTGGNLVTAGSVTATGTVTGGNIATAGTVTATGTITGGNVVTGGAVTATGDITGGNVYTGGAISATGTATVGNVLTGGIISATSTIQGGNVLTAGEVSAGGSLTGGNVYTGGVVSAVSTVTGGNLATAGTVTATGTITGGNVITGGVVSATGDITGGNVFTGGIVSATGNITGNYFFGNGSQLTGIDTNLIKNGDSNVRILTANGNISMDVNGTSNVVVVTTGGMSVTGNVESTQYTLGANAVFGTSLTATTGATVAINSTDSILMPVGNTQQRPSGVTGMLRFNTTTDKLEVYDSNSWEEVGATVFTVIGDQQFTGDGSTLTFTLSDSQTTNSCIVSINGVVQIPGTAYSVSGTTLTFTEAPQPGDDIDVRKLTTTTTVTYIQNSPANAAITVTDTSNVITVTGQLQGSGNVISIVGDLTVSGNATITGNVATNSISNGNSRVEIPTTNGNVNIDVGATNNMAVFTETGAFITGNLSVTGNVTAQDVNSLSDVTLKTNIQPISGIESVLFGLNGYEYDWKNGSGHSYGFLAQEVEKVLPNAVKTGADGLKAINYMMIIPFLVETIKQMGTEIRDLKNTVSSRDEKK